MGWFFVVEGEKVDVKEELAQDGAVHLEVANTSKGSPKYCQSSCSGWAPSLCWVLRGHQLSSQRPHGLHGADSKNVPTLG